MIARIRAQLIGREIRGNIHLCRPRLDSFNEDESPIRDAPGVQYVSSNLYESLTVTRILRRDQHANTYMPGIMILCVVEPYGRVPYPGRNPAWTIARSQGITIRLEEWIPVTPEYLDICQVCKGRATLFRAGYDRSLHNVHGHVGW